VRAQDTGVGVSASGARAITGDTWDYSSGEPKRAVPGRGGSTGISAGDVSCPADYATPPNAARRPSFRKATITQTIQDAPRDAEGHPICIECGTRIGGTTACGSRDWDVDHYPERWIDRVRSMPYDIPRNEVIRLYNEYVRAICPTCNRSNSQGWDR
jgi:hypothetical protein